MSLLQVKGHCFTLNSLGKQFSNSQKFYWKKVVLIMGILFFLPNVYIGSVHSCSLKQDQFFHLHLTVWKILFLIPVLKGGARSCSCKSGVREQLYTSCFIDNFRKIHSSQVTCLHDFFAGQNTSL